MSRFGNFESSWAVGKRDTDTQLWKEKAYGRWESVDVYDRAEIKAKVGKNQKLRFEVANQRAKCTELAKILNASIMQSYSIAWYLTNNTRQSYSGTIQSS
jgi:hypothetical protein